MSRPQVDQQSVSFHYCFNGQAIVDERGQVVHAASVCQSGADSQLDTGRLCRAPRRDHSQAWDAGLASSRPVAVADFWTRPLRGLDKAEHR
jgi:hypothetical protein